MRHILVHLVILLTGLVVLCNPGYGQEGQFYSEERSLYWDAVEVTAHLDADGRLHVKERQKMVFDGPWNGGERTFNVTVPQELEFEALSRVTPRTSALVPLSLGNLEQVDEYQWFFSPHGYMLRWRSRLPNDPPFKKTKITYLLEYSYSNILLQKGDTYLLNHNFAFTQREGNISRFKLKLTWDDRWSPLKPLSKNLARNNLLPGEGVIVQTTFRHLGSVPPQHVIRPIPARERYSYLAALFIVCVGFFWVFYRYEKFLGWYDPPIPPDKIDEEWLQQYVFSLPPEVVGSEWDQDTNTPEVSALLARLEVEGKLRSQIKDKELHLELLVNPKELQGYEAKLVKALFLKGKHTNAQLLRKYYHKRGFEPVYLLQRALRKNVAQGLLTKTLYVWLGLLGLAIYAEVLLFSAPYASVESHGFASGGTLIVNFFYFVWSIEAGRYRMNNYHWLNIDILRQRMFKLLVVLLLLPGVIAVLIFVDPLMFPSQMFLGSLLLVVVFFGAAFVRIQAGTSREQVQLRQRLIAARHFFEQELNKPVPQLKNEWYPYLIAYELTAEMDHWFNIHAQQTHSPSSSFKDNDSGKETIQTKPAGWTGGGGSFGGGGSTGDWAATAATLVSSIPTPSSSHSSSGGSGRSSSSGSSRSSGGGGGGGW